MGKGGILYLEVLGLCTFCWGRACLKRLQKTAVTDDHRQNGAGEAWKEEEKGERGNSKLGPQILPPQPLHLL